MSILFLASFIGGLLLAVQIMIAGVERSREEHPSGERTFRMSPPLIASMAMIFGVIGYILHRQLVGNNASQILIAAVLAIVTGIITARVVREWWKVTPEHETDDERFVLQGHVARVTQPITGTTGEGEVTYVIGDKTFVHPARGIDETVLEAGSEVVIERIEDDVAYVESWVEVEKRL